MTTSNQKIKPGRVETLTDDQERVLKEVWMYFLHFAGYSINPPGPFIKSKSIHSTHSVKRTESISEKSKKKGGFFSKLKRNKKDETPVTTGHHQNLEKTLSNQSSLDPNVKHSTDLEIHHALKGLNSKDMFNSFWRALRHDSPDNLLLRFIRARKWDVDNSLLMIAHTLQWRHNESKVDDLLFSSELGCLEKKKDGVLKQFEVGKCIIRGKDKENRPLVIIRPRFHHSSEQTSEEIEIFTLLIIEYARLLLTEPVDSCTLIFDLHGFTMANMDYEPVKYIIKAFEAHYPESLGILLIHRAPWIFSGIWQIVKNWLDPVVASKIQFTKSTADLEKIIDKNQLIKDLGGDDDYEWEYLHPTETQNGLLKDDKALKEKLDSERDEIIQKFSQKTIEWIESKDELTSRKLLNERIAIGKKLSESYKKYDGFIRNRGIYDRLGYVTFS